MVKPYLTSLLAFFALALLSSGCGLSGNVKRDMDGEEVSAEPTSGGLWSERGQLGGGLRSPASVQEYGGGGSSWVSPENEEANARDQYRSIASEDGPTYSAQPNNPPPNRRAYKNGARATKQDFIDDSKQEGSLWAADGQNNYYFSKNKIRGVGDIITINAENDFVRDIGNEILRTLTPEEKEMELDEAQARLDKEAQGDTASGSSTDRSTASKSKDKKDTKKKDSKSSDEPRESRDATLADVDMMKSINIKPDDTVMAEIVERFPNGNYKVRGTKKVLYRGSTRIVNVMAIAKGSEISEDDVVKSGKLYEYRLEARR